MPGAKAYPGNAVATTLSTSLADGAALSVQIAAQTGWPTGSGGSWVARIGKGTAKEEKVLVATRSGAALTIGTRGYDGTTAVAHDPGEIIECCWDADSAAEMNAHVNDDARDDHSQYYNAARLAALALPGRLDSKLGTGGGQAGISSITDITNLSSTVTPGNGRWIKLTAYCPFLKVTSTGIVTLSIREGATVLASADRYSTVSQNDSLLVIRYFQLGDAAAHTYKASIAANVGTVTTVVSGGYVPSLLVEAI